MKRAPVLTLMTAGLALAVVPAFLAGAPRLIWNASASVPKGLYWRLAPAPLQVGDLVALRPPPRLGAWLAVRGVLPAGVPLIKHVAALPPSQVCRRAGVVTVDGRPSARAAPADGRGRALPRWSGCRRLERDEIFLLNPAPGSLDSRYFGPLPRGAVIGRLTPVWLLRASSNAP